MYYSATTGGFYHKSLHGGNIPSDAVEISEEAHAALIADGREIGPDESGYPVLIDPPALTQDQIVRQYEITLDRHLDAVAKSHRYDNRFTFVARAGYPGPWQADGIAFGTWMDTCNEQAYMLLQNVLAGTAELPTIEDFIAALPPHD